MNIQELIDNVRQWGIDRGITGPQGQGTLISQLDKAYEEYVETLTAAHNKDRYETIDGIGDMTVCLILAAELAGTTFEECLEAAWMQIRDRKGKMVKGKFVKEKPTNTEQ